MREKKPASLPYFSISHRSEVQISAKIGKRQRDLLAATFFSLPLQDSLSAGVWQVIIADFYQPQFTVDGATPPLRQKIGPIELPLI